MRWSPCGTRIAVWNNYSEFKFQVFAFHGAHLFTCAEDGFSFGPKSLSWSHCGRLLAVGLANEPRIRLFNTLTWTSITDFGHPMIIRSDEPEYSDCRIFEETEVIPDDIDGKIVAEWLQRKATCLTEVTARPAALPSIKNETVNASKFQNQGIASMTFSENSRFLACVCEKSPRTLWIWDIRELSLHTAIVLRQLISSFEWEPLRRDSNNSQPSSSSLLPARMIFTSSSMENCFMWTEHGVVSFQLPDSSLEAFSDETTSKKTSWNPKGKVFSMISKSEFICCKVKSSKKL